jgi:predicted DNA-binding protein (MmcQ/YjbR family)
MASSPLTEMRRICLSLPETTETPTWGEPHFRVRGKIFAGCGNHGGVITLGFKLEREHADQAVRDPRFARAPYVGQHGWISMDARGVRDWGEVRALVLESYRLIAPRALWAEAQGGKVAEKKTPARRKTGPSRRRKSSAAPRKRRRSTATRR